MSHAQGQRAYAPLVFLAFLVLVAALVWGALVTPFSMEPPPR